MFKKISIIVGLFWTIFQANAQLVGTSDGLTDTPSTDSIKLPDNRLIHAMALEIFWKKLILLQKNNTGKLNIVHVGDSHIQADLMTAVIRKNCQNRFGNAGRGFVFPHQLAKTNGAWDVRFSSNATWECHKNIAQPNGSAVGLSGIALQTKAQNAYIELTVKDPENFFNTIKVISPNNNHDFDLALNKQKTAIETKLPKKISHKVKKGEALSTIAESYHCSMAEIKALNRLKSNNIQAGKTLKIPTTETTSKISYTTSYIPEKSYNSNQYFYYKSENLLSKIAIVAQNDNPEKILSGLVLENNNPGILYHNIGVNGAKYADYNKYPLFFNQLKALNPDLIIVSLGTNESFDRMSSESYMQQVFRFINNIKLWYPDTAILLTTPPPSLLYRKLPNTYIADYTEKLITFAAENRYAIWDAYTQLRGMQGVSINARKGWMAPDRVHYTKLGYEIQGKMLFEALLQSFEDYQNNPNKKK
ncbi:hypothetical protein B0A58_08115 [Flavobacterium branchiophilum NBRC 15030 = ATCC 35035]|uniref:LysM repeat protein n=1 Tax=Flavobacterium branchiophilum TaxID=55197 RepID=A0A543G5X8_9FLAO|nr:LysM peptidoglycan-binding domain-containing protein [Flavobacterium branchiophilum]OXA75948.1 hypothetical protein B0A58_08115 [Flavobacterium branchiophilum NBRC 15030 = ATCC 35035]TQM41489.1 LysM repeat protein [Flavobacterium branchiophilum]GEM54191.1 hypothetical protein FB1_04120 [Flavobacterium branchiophilum NBRC 15030 = ATCC 35035]